MKTLIALSLLFATSAQAGLVDGTFRCIDSRLYNSYTVQSYRDPVTMWTVLINGQSFDYRRVNIDLGRSGYYELRAIGVADVLYCKKMN